jgi:cullin 4
VVATRKLRFITKTTVSMIVGDKERDDEMVSRLLVFKAFADKTVNTAFVDQVHVTIQDSSSTSTSSTLPEEQLVPNQEFVYALTDAFQAGFRSRRNKPAEMIAKYLDKAMRKGQRDTSDADFNEVLDNALALYRFTDDKDVFRTYYHRALAKRLLTSRSASDAFETSILKRLKESECLHL